MLENVAEPCQNFVPWSNIFIQGHIRKEYICTFREGVEGFETWNKQKEKKNNQKKRQ